MPAERDPAGAQPGGPPAPFLRGLLEQAAARWRRLSTGSVNRRVLGAALVIGAMTMATKLVSVVKESLVAARYGTGSDYDAFIIALLVPSTIGGIVSGSLNAALIPTYIQVREQEGPEAAHRLYTTILLWNTVVLLALLALLVATDHYWLPIIASGFDPAKLALARLLLRVSFPMVLLVGFATTWGALLNAAERFALVAAVPTLQPVGIILALAVVGRSWGIYALLAGTLLGVLLEVVALGVALARRGHPLLPRWHGSSPAFRRVLAQYGACIGASFLVNGNGLVDQAFASTLGPRSNSALSYGSKLVSLVLSLGATALGTAILPQLSKLTAKNDWGGIRRFLRLYLWAIAAVTVPATILLMVLSPQIIRLMYQHGSFTAADTDLVVRIQIFYLLRVPFATCGVLATRTLTALKANQVMLWTSIISFAVNALLDWVLIARFGIAGITLSTSLCSCLMFSITLWLMYITLRRQSRADQPRG